MSEAAYLMAGADCCRVDGGDDAAVIACSVRSPECFHGGSQTLLFGQDASIGYLVKSDRLVPLKSATNTLLRPIKFPALIDASEATGR